MGQAKDTYLANMVVNDTVDDAMVASKWSICIPTKTPLY
jgi:hypothetical protein